MSTAAIPTPLQYFGRQWQLSVKNDSGDILTISNAKSESLRVTFTVDTYSLLAYWTANVKIYNMAPSTGNQIQGVGGVANLWQFNQPLSAGNQITISAGYTNSSGGTFDAQNNVIYAGRVLQSYWSRENVVDWVLNLRCVIGLLENTINQVNQAVKKGTNDYLAVKSVCREASLNLVIDQATQDIMSANTYSRGLSLYGRPVELIKEITGQYQGQILSWISDKGVNISSFNPSVPLATPAFAYAPINVQTNTVSNSGNTQPNTIKYTLIETPQQTQLGVTFKVLMDSTPKIRDTVQLAPGVLINLFPLTVPIPKGGPPVPNASGLYIVCGLRYVGDTRGRGNDWYTEITGLSQSFFANFLTASSTN